MQNIPVFTARNGMASLILREIPYNRKAYVLVRAIWDGQAEALLQECAAFCRGAGAEEVYASDGVNDLPGVHAYDVLKLSCSRETLPHPVTAVELESLSGANGSEYLRIYNGCFRDVPGAASYTHRDLRRLMESDSGYLARRNGQYAGVAELDPDGLAGIGVLPEFKGLGYDLALAVLQKVEQPQLYLKVASTNTRAISLYRRIGFGNDTLVSRWWRV